MIGRFATVIATLLTFVAGTVYSQTPATSAPAEPIDEKLRAVLLQAVNNADSFDDRFDAEVWLSDMSQRLERQVPDLDERLHILRTVHQNATKLEIAPELVLAIIEVESNFDRYAISSSSALGLMQVMPFWVEELGGSSQSELLNVEYNILLGCQILKYYLDMEDGELVPALGRYNGSLGRRTYADKVINALRSGWFRA
ncbi:MAG: lytic transglycosylase domain-containing protein [Candidatus Rariloculaceae bacterium]